MPGMEYWTLQDGDRAAFGLMAMPPGYAANVPSHWNIYLRVEDVDAGRPWSCGCGHAVPLGALQHPVRTPSVCR